MQSSSASLSVVELLDGRSSPNCPRGNSQAARPETLRPQASSQGAGHGSNPRTLDPAVFAYRRNRFGHARSCGIRQVCTFVHRELIHAQAQNEKATS
jgi:hypothetical protein